MTLPPPLPSLPDFFLALLRDRGDLVPLLTAGRPAILVNDAELLHHLLVRHPERFDRGVTHWQHAAPLLTEEGAILLARKSAPRGQSTGDLHRAVGSRLGSGLGKKLRARIGEPGQNFDLVRIVHRANLLEICAILFDYDLSEGGDAFLDAVRAMDESRVRERAAYFQGLTDEHADSLAASLQAAIDELMRLGTLIYRARERATNYPAPTAGNLIEIVRGIIEVLIFSYESFSNALCFALTLAAMEPEQTSILLEDEASETGGGYCAMFVKEVLRLFPVAWMTTRHTQVDDRLGDFAVPAGCDIVFSPYTLHRHRRYWINPEQFDPTRFAGTVGRENLAYCPFGAGSRMCVAASFSFKQLGTILHGLLSQFELLLDENFELAPVLLTSLRPNITGVVIVRAR